MSKIISVADVRATLCEIVGWERFTTMWTADIQIVREGLRPPQVVFSDVSYWEAAQSALGELAELCDEEGDGIASPAFRRFVVACDRCPATKSKWVDSWLQMSKDALKKLRQDEGDSGKKPEPSDATP